MIGRISESNSPDGEMSLLKSELAAAGIVKEGLEWQLFSGGRTNRIWRIGQGDHALVCKLFNSDGGTILFPNDIAAESSALRALSGTGLAPVFICEFKSSRGLCLIYRYSAGRPWRGDVRAVSETLARLHQLPPPAKIRKIHGSADAIHSLGNAILTNCYSARAGNLRSLRPELPDCANNSRVFLHGDLVPGNIICGPGGIVLIDWQCPAIGDPCEDISTFLSPAMQSLYGHRPLSDVEQTDLLDAYTSPVTKARYLALKPLFHWRMAAHCLWKYENGQAEYRPAMELEIAALKQC